MSRFEVGLYTAKLIDGIQACRAEGRVLVDAGSVARLAGRGRPFYTE
jgi:hypothetical protein